MALGWAYWGGYPNVAAGVLRRVHSESGFSAVVQAVMSGIYGPGADS